MLLILGLYWWWVVTYRPLARRKLYFLPRLYCVVLVDRWKNTGERVMGPERDHLLFDHSIGRRR